MNILLCGGGRVGATLLEYLVKDGHDLTVIDHDPACLQWLKSRFDIQVVRGSSSHPTVLMEAGADDADVVIAVTGSDEVNLLTCHLCYTLFQTPTKIGRVRSEVYMQQTQLLHQALSLDVCVNTAGLIVRDLMRRVHYPGALQVLEFAQGLVQLLAIKAQIPSVWVGKTIQAWYGHLPEALMQVVAIYRDDQLVDISPDTVILMDDEIYVMVADQHVRDVIQALGHAEAPYHRVLIAGGGVIGLRLAQSLQSLHHVKVIEKEKSRATLIAKQVDDATILWGNALDDTFLSQEHIEQIDLFCGLTQRDDTNLIACMQAKRLGAHTTLSLVNDTSYLSWGEEYGVDVILSPQQIILSSMLRYFRQGDVIQGHAVRQGQAEAIEVIVHGDRQNSMIVGRVLRELPLPPKSCVAALIRRGKVVACRDAEVVQPYDHMIIWVGDKQHLPTIEQLFQVKLGYLGD